MNDITLSRLPFRHMDDLLRSWPTPASHEELDEMVALRPGIMESVDEALVNFVLQWGEPYGYIQEQNGRVVQNLFPIASTASEQISSSSTTPLELHTETAFHPYRPDLLVLLCVRGDATAGTVFSRLAAALPLLGPHHIEALHEPAFTTTLDLSFQNQQQSDSIVTTPVLFDEGTRITFDLTLMKATTAEGDSALQALTKAILRVQERIVLAAGDVLAMNNHRVVHGRTPFTPRYDGTDRWLKRVMVRRTPPPARDYSPLHVGGIITTML